MTLGSLRAARAAQLSAQSLTGVALALTLLSADVFNAMFLVAALVVTFRRDGSANDGAISNFAAAMLVSGGILQSLLGSVIDPDAGAAGSTAALLLLVSTVLFAFAGAFFWLQRRNGGE